MPLPVLKDRVTPGKYAIVRTAPSVSAADYAGRAQVCGLTGLVFKLNDKDQLLAEWLPDPAGADWQKLQYMLGTAGGLDALLGYGLKVGVMFDAGKGAYEVPTEEGTSWAGIMRLLDPLGIKIDFFAADITIEPRWADALNMQWYTADYTRLRAASARSLSSLVAASRAAQVGRVRPIYLITPAEPLHDWSGLYDNQDIGHDGFSVLSPTTEPYTNAVLSLAHRVDPANGTADTSTAWLWHETNNGTETLVRGEFVFDLRTTIADAEALKGMVQYVVNGFDITMSDLGIGGDCTWHPTAGLVMFDDLDAVESKGFCAAVGEALTPTDFWDLDIYEGGPCLEGPPGDLVWWALGQTPALVAGQPWEARLAIESWRLGVLPNWIFLYSMKTCAEVMDPTLPMNYASWLYVGTLPVLFHAGAGFATRVEGELEDYIDPATGLAHKIFHLHGTPTAADTGARTLELDFYGGFLNFNTCGVFTLVVGSTVVPIPPIGVGSTVVSDMLHPIVPFMGNRGSPCLPIAVGLAPGPIVPPGPGGVGDCGQTTTFNCPDGDWTACNSILNIVWVAAGKPTDWEEMAFYIAVLFRESGDMPMGDTAGDCCPNVALDCTRCIVCAASSDPTSCCCSFGLFQLNRCGGQGADYGCVELLDPITNAVIAMVALLSAWSENKAAGYTGMDLYKRVAADSGHPGSSASGEASRQAIASLTTCIAASPLVFPLPTFGLVWPLHGALNADCAWHMAVETLSAIDINCSGGETIKAAHTGTVTFAGLDPRSDPAQGGDPSMGYGYTVEIADASYPEYVTKYGHMQAGLLVTAGDHVTAGVTGLGLCDSTGHSTGPHLHFELRHNGVTVCPCTYLTGGC
jgi:hypothetical protein